MAPATGPYGQPRCAQQRPYYVSSPPVGQTHSRPERGSHSAAQNGNASPSVPSLLPAGGSPTSRNISTSAASRLHPASPSAYSRFDEVSWIVDLTSRIESALQTPPRQPGRTSADASPSPSSSQVPMRARRRVQISKEFRELQQKVQAAHASTSVPVDSSIETDSAAQIRAHDSISAVQWAQHAQQDFERRCVDLERSRRGTLNSLEPRLCKEEEQREKVHPRGLEPGASGSVDPAVERSMLAAKSLQELMRNGGLQSEDSDDRQSDFADLLANAEPLPGVSAELGPSSLFEANRGADGTLDIESILQQRARMTALDEHNQAAFAQPEPSLIDLSQSANVKATRRPVIEVLGAHESASGSDTSGQPMKGNQSTSTDAEDNVASGDSSSESSSESENPDDVQVSESGADAATDGLSETSANAMVLNRQEAYQAAHPMDQITIVDGTFRIVPAHSQSAIGQQSMSPQRHKDTEGSSIVEDDSDREESHDHDSEDEQMEDEFGSDAPDASAEDDEDNELDESAEDNRYYDGYQGMGTRDLLFEGPTGDADEPIVLSDSDEDTESADVEEETDEDAQDELVDESDGRAQSDAQSQDDAERSDADLSTQQVQASWQSQTNRPHEDSQQGDEDEKRPGEHSDAGQEATEQYGGDVPANASAASAKTSKLADDQLSKEQESEIMPTEMQVEATASQSFPSFQGESQLQFRNYIDHEDRDAMPDSEVEPDEFDEDLRWSDIEATQPTDSDSSYPQGRTNAEADAAFRTAQASQPMPGFVTASQLVAGVKAGGATADAGGDSLVTGGDPPLQIDPQLLAAFAATQQTADLLGSKGSTSATAFEAGSSGQEQSATQTDTDVFDTFVRPSASLAAREPTVEEVAEDTLPSAVHPEERQDDTEALNQANNTDHDLPTMLSGTAVEKEAPVAAREFVEGSGGAMSEMQLIGSVKKEGSGSPVLANAEHKNEETHGDLQLSNTYVDVVSVGASVAQLPNDGDPKILQAAHYEEASRLAGFKAESPFAKAVEDGQKPADNEGSVQRQALSRNTTSEPAPKGEGDLMQDEGATGRLDESEPASSSRVPMKRKEVDSCPANNEKVEEVNIHPEEIPTELMLKKPKLETEPGNVKLEHPTASDSGPQRDHLEPPASAGLSSPSMCRVPPSPASSDRRSVSSFTPSANRHGHRHLHGSTKRNLLAQMTEAATNFASNLTAPLRSIPSLLPIRESSANEAEEGDEANEVAVAPEATAEDKDQVEDRSQAAQTTKKAEPVEFTMKTRSHCYYRQLELSNMQGLPVFIVPGCSIDYIHAEDEKARDLGPTTEQDSQNWIDVNPDFLPIDVHHTLSRIIGLDMLNEGIFAEPDSSAAKLLLSGYSIDEDLPMSFGEQGYKHELAQLEPETQVTGKAEADTHDMPKAAVVTIPEEGSDAGVSVNVEAAADAVGEEPETPSRVYRQSSRHRRAASSASSSSHHRSPRRSDPMSANADYLPDRERELLHQERHPASLIPGDLSIASIEKQLDGEDDDNAGSDERLLQDIGDTTGDGGNGIEDENTADAASASAPFSVQPKKKRGKPRKSAANDLQNSGSAQEEEANENSSEPPPRAKPKTGRGRKRAALPAEASEEGQAATTNDAAEMEDATETAASKTKRARRGRTSEQAAASGASQQNQDREGAVSGGQETSGAVRTGAIVQDEDAILQQSDDHEPEERGSQEARVKSNARRRGSRARNRKEAAGEVANAALAEAIGAETASRTIESAGATQPRRSRRSDGASRAQGTTPHKTSPRKTSRRNVLKLN